MESEAAIERAILDYLNARDDVLAFKYGVKAKYGKGRGCNSNGIADIVVNYQVSEMCFVVYMEVKHQNGKQRVSQYEFEQKIKGLSGLYYIVRSVEDAKNALKDARQEIGNNIQIAQIPW